MRIPPRTRRTMIATFFQSVGVLSSGGVGWECVSDGLGFFPVFFGEEDSEGSRSVERKEETLLFTSCKIRLLVEGKIMILSFDKDLWYTSKVKRIELLEEE